MKPLRGAVVAGVVVLAISVFALALEYPWSTYSAFEFSRWSMLVSYAVVAVFTATVASITAGIFLWVPDASRLFRTLVCGAATLGVLVLLALLFGPLGIDVPGTHVSGIFFSEWKFINFTFFVSGPAALASAAICYWEGRTRSD